MSELKLIGGIGLDINPLSKGFAEMEREFRKAGENAEKFSQRVRNALLASDKEWKQQQRMISETITYAEKYDKASKTYRTQELRTSKYIRDGVATTRKFVDDKPKSETIDNLPGIKEINNHYVAQVKLLNEIGKIKLQWAGKENQMTTSARERLKVIENEYKINKELVVLKGRRNLLDSETGGQSLRDAEKEREIREKAIRLESEISQKTQRVQGEKKRTADIKKVNTLYTEQSRLIKEIGQIQREMFTVGPKEKEVLKGTLAIRQRELSQVQADISQSKYQNAEKEAAAQKLIASEAQKTAQAEARANDQRVRGKQMLDTMYRTMVAMMTVYAIRLLRNTWREATDFVKEYYDALNEVRIVTGMTEKEADKLGETYSQLAQKMMVSSKEVAKTAAEFWRQGLGKDEVSARLEATTKYAKISSLAFDQSAEIITAATNSFKDFNMTAEKAADIFSYLGDMSAAGADEIGIAMERAAASAAEFKLSFEWLGSYVATISEQTRLAPEIIGTSMKSLLSRLYAIRETGFNEEDEVDINQVSKALGEIDVALMDSEGRWRSFSDIMNDISLKWNDIDDKQRAYISTTMAGIRQQNVFLALMRDLAKGLDGGSRAWELYEGAMESNGAATEKYAIYMESVAAAQDDMKNSLEALYGSIMNGNIMKEFYTMVAEFVDSLKSGLDVLGDIDIKTIAFVATIGAATLAITRSIKAINTALTAGSLLGGLNFRTAIMGLAALATVIITIAGKIKEASDPIKSFGEELQRLNDGQDKWNKRIADLEGYKVSIEGVKNSTLTAAEKQAEYNTLLKNLVNETPSLTSALQETNGEWKSIDDALSGVNGKMREYAKLRDAEANANAKRALISFTDEVEEPLSKLNNYEKLIEYLNAVKEFSLSTSTGRDQTEEYKKVFYAREAAAPGLQDLAAIFGVNVDMSHLANIDVFAEKMLKDGIDTYIDAARTLFGVAGDEMKLEISKFKVNLITALMTTEGLTEAPVFIQEMVSSYADELVTQIENADFTGASKGNLLGALFALFDQGVGHAEKDIMGNIPRLTAERIAKSWQDSTVNGANVWPNLADELFTGFGDSLVAIEKNLDKYFPKEFAKTYWTNFVNNLWLGFTPGEMMASVNLDSSPFTMLQTETAKLFEKTASFFGSSESDITSAYNNILALAPNEENRGYLSNIFNALFGDLTGQQYETMLNALKKGENINNLLIEWMNVPDGQGAGVDGAAESLKKLQERLEEFMKKAKVLAAQKKNFIPQLQSLYGGYGEFGESGFQTEYNKLDPEMADALWGDENASKIMAMMINGAGLAEIIAEITTLMTNTDMEAANENLDKVANRFKTLYGIVQDLEEGKGISFDTAIKNLEEFPIFMELIGESLEKQATEVNKLLGPEETSLFDILFERMMVGNEGASPEYKETMAGFVRNAISVMIEEMTDGQDEAAEAWKEFISVIKGNVDTENIDSLWEKDRLESYRNKYTDMLSGGDVSGFLTEMKNIQDPDIGTDYQREVIERLKQEWDGFAEAILLAEENGEDFTSVLEKMTNSSKKLKLDKAFDDAAGDFDELQKGGKKAAKVLDNVTKESKDMKKALSAMSFIQEGQYKNQEELNEAYQAMGNYLGMSIEDADDFAAAQAMMSGATAQTGQWLNYMVNGMIAANAVGIDSSGNVVAIGDIGKAAEAAGMDVDTFRALLASINKAGFKFQISPDGLSGEVKSWVNQSALPKFKPTASSSGGGGGGGGSGQTEIQKFLDQLSQLKSIDDFLRKMVQMRGSLYEARGELTNYIQAVEQEINVVKARNDVDEAELQQIDERMRAQQELVASMSTSNKNYEQASSDLKSLQSTHQEYTETVEQNKIELEELNDTLEDTRNAIRDMQIDLRETIHEAIMDREELNQSMLENEIAIQEEVLAVIEARYQKEWDLIKENIDAQKQALEEEKKLIDEELNARKDAAKKADKYAELRGYESQLSIISADPTRAKDQLELRNKIADLREEIAWDLAETEANAQKESIDQQIMSLDDYLEKMNTFYEVLFENPQQMYQEMTEIFKASDADLIAWAMANVEGFALMTEEQQKQTINTIHQLMYATNGEVVNWMSEHVTGFTNLNETEQERLMTSVRTMVKDSNEYVVAWLQQNNQEFQAATDAQKESMSNGWLETMIAMRGATVTYWDEVEQIISQGDAAIIAFLKANSEEYRLAGKMQAEALVDEWQKKLDDLKAALTNTYQRINEMPTDKYVTIHVSTVENGGGAGKTPIDPDVVVVGGGGNWGMSVPGKSTQLAFASGGLVDYTGTAQVHGSPTNPEAFLSAVDTKMIRGLLDGFKFIVPRFGGIKSQTGANGNVTIEEINISVDKLDNDADLEDLANKVGEKFAKAMTVKRGVSVGNLRIK